MNPNPELHGHDVTSLTAHDGYAAYLGADTSQTAITPEPPGQPTPARTTDASVVRRDHGSTLHHLGPTDITLAQRTDIGAPSPLLTPELLTGIVARPTRLRSRRGVRGVLNRAGFRFPVSPAEQHVEQRRERIRRALPRIYRVAVISVKGGVGRTVTTAALGSTFARLRPDRVVAIDASPYFGDLATRTRRHPYGLTLRDLAHALDTDVFSTVQAYLSTTTADLAVAAAPWSNETIHALSAAEYVAATDILRRHFSLMLIDCHTGILEPVTSTVLHDSDAAVIVTPATISGLTGAAATLNWLGSHGFARLVHRATVAITHQHPGKPAVDGAAIAGLFATINRPTCALPYDPHLAEGGEVDLRLLHDRTRTALEELAAALADDFPGLTLTGPPQPELERSP
ncbi:MinD/ParA family protein [Nocardia sp. NPDC057668]|uniref:MinD/ParA family ATP-binding protein n=1 Tax=Nocardia sp. NPDC057668 TaxID=3346202 RepID=UPI003672EDE1